MWKFDGKHLVVDAVVVDPAPLCEAKNGNLVLQDIVQRIDMTMILPPVTIEFPHAPNEIQRVIKKLESEGLGESQTALMLKSSLRDRIEQSYGFSTIVMIAESHLSLHTFPKTKFFTFDCYSCKDFDHELVLEILRERFGITEEFSNVMKRVSPERE